LTQAIQHSKDNELIVVGVLCGGVAHDKSVVHNYKKTKEGLVELGLDRRQLICQMMMMRQ
jgi:hypothetical protein